MLLATSPKKLKVPSFLPPDEACSPIIFTAENPALPQISSIQEEWKTAELLAMVLNAVLLP